MAVTPGDVIDEVQRHLRDTGAGTWADADCVEYFNNATYMVMLLRPSAFSATSSVQLTANSTKHSITGAYRILDVTRNMGSDGSTEGKIVTPIERWQIDMLNQHWHKGTGKTYIEHYSYEPDKSLTTFYTYPKAHATTAVYVEMNLATFPTKVTTGNQATKITLDATFEPFIKEWMFYEAYNKNTSPSSYNQSQRHLQLAASMMGMKVQAIRETQAKMKEGA